ncbi:MAG: 1-acyl-sn-glycerol-3-phosphate acyltransferase [Tenericutes bacterium]|nr:1-acyl-sn-glycerol-3-phosphate acyltransferase [Mycoplasmatota bacterium]
MRLREEIARFFLKLIFHSKYRFKFTYENFDPKRKEPFFLIGNHVSLNDPLYVGMNIRHYPYPVASNILYTHPVEKFALTHMVKSIPKRKGQNDIQTIRSILKAFHEDQRGIMIFPEGNSSFFGEQTKTDFQSTAKLIQKLKHDVVIAKNSGGYFAAPRWGKKRKRGYIHIHYKTLLTKKDVEQKKINEIESILEDAIEFNEYEWNRKEKIKYKSKHKAEGLEGYLYACPICKEIHTILTKGNDIYCTTCGKISTINAYEFLENLQFDTLIEWGKFQKILLPKVVEYEVKSLGILYEVNFQKGKRIYKGNVEVSLKNKILKITNLKQQLEFPVNDVEGLVLTQKNFLSFDYKGLTFLIKIKDPMIFLDSIKYLRGE